MEPQSNWQRWIRHPQLLGWRRIVVQLHLWIGLTLGIYLLVLSVSGSLSVLRPDVHRWFVPRTVAVVGTRLTGDELQAAVRRTYPEYEVTNVFERLRPAKLVVRTYQCDAKWISCMLVQYASGDSGRTELPAAEAME